MTRESSRMCWRSKLRTATILVEAIAAERCGATLAEGGWMIGDNPTADIAGGRAVGLRTIWINRGT
ncbi:HAD hydrolase-like protein [Microbispora sp. NPDC088329]|uniref:HAD hydrolase-like protein n=1 Tax=Microbispora sp. NPDC088329 TaxID=3154869 RepID=UPI003422C774